MWYKYLGKNRKNLFSGFWNLWYSILIVTCICSPWMVGKIWILLNLLFTAMSFISVCWLQTNFFGVICSTQDVILCLITYLLWPVVVNELQHKPFVSLYCVKNFLTLLNLFFLIDLLRLTRTSSGEIREKTQCKINKVMMGKVMSNNIKILFEF